MGDLVKIFVYIKFDYRVLYRKYLNLIDNDRIDRL